MNINTGIPFKQAKNYKRGRLRPVQLIVLHSMEAAEKGNTAENVASYFAGANAPMASAHFCIDNNSIVQSVRLEDTAYHCKNANANGIGIEHAGYAKQTTSEWLDEYGQQMLELSAELAASLCHQFNIPVRRAKFAGKNNPQVVESGLCGHADVPLHGTHYDPGKGFPWDYYLERVQFHFDGSESELKAFGTSDAIQHAAGSDLVSDSLPTPSVETLPDEPTQPLTDAANVPAAQTNEAGSAGVVIQPNALTSPSPIVPSGEKPIDVQAVTPEKSGSKKSIWATIIAGISFLGLNIQAFFSNAYATVKDNPTAALGLIVGCLVVLVIYWKYQERQTKLDELREKQAFELTKLQMELAGNQKTYSVNVVKGK